MLFVCQVSDYTKLERAGEINNLNVTAHKKIQKNNYLRRIYLPFYAYVLWPRARLNAVHTTKPKRNEKKKIKIKVFYIQFFDKKTNFSLRFIEENKN